MLRRPKPPKESLEPTTRCMIKRMPIFHIWPKVTSRDENAGNSARFSDKVVEVDKKRSLDSAEADSACFLRMRNPKSFFIGGVRFFS